MARSALKRTLSLILAFMLAISISAMLALGICQIVFELAVIGAFDKHTNNNQVMRWPEHSPTGAYHDLATKPEYLRTGATTAIVVEGILSIVVAALFLLSILAHLCTTDHRSESPVSTLINYL